MNPLVLRESDVEGLNRLFDATAPLEQGCFFLLREGRGAQGSRLVASEMIAPPADGWESQQPGQLRPSARFISSAVSRAIASNAGLLFVHSHPDPMFPVGFSPIDEDALITLGNAIGPMLDGPLAAAVVHPDGWSASRMASGELHPVERVASLGRILRVISIASERDKHGQEPAGIDDRQRDALGDVHDRLRELDVAVVGVGGLGSPVAEQLVRMGVGGVTLIDSGSLDTASNVRRVIGSRMVDLSATLPSLKVDVVGRHLEDLGMATRIRRVNGDIREEGVFRELLDVDVVICCTDTHGSRAVINDLPSAYFLPVVDVGAQAGSRRNGALAALAAEVRVLTPTTPCLWRRGTISGDVIRAENLPPDQRERLVADGYLVGGVGDPAPSVVALTVLGAGLATCTLLALLSEESRVGRSGFVFDGFLGDLTDMGLHQPKAACRCQRQTGLADTSPPPLLSRKAV